MPELDRSSADKQVHIVYLVARVYHALRATRIEPVLKSAGITPLQYTIMTVVAAHEGLSSAELSRRFYVTPQTMGQVLATLEKRGLLRRREDPENRRVLCVSLTAKGSRMVEQSAIGIATIEQELFGLPNHKENAEFRKKLLEIAAYLRSTPSPPTDAGPAARRKRTSKPT